LAWDQIDPNYELARTNHLVIETMQEGTPQESPMAVTRFYVDQLRKNKPPK
jgi:hypothetical protein